MHANSFVGDKSPEDQYEIKADPKNIRDGRPYGTLVVLRDQERKFDLGGNYIVPRGFESLLAIDDVSVLAGGFDVHGRVHLSLSLYDECNRLLAAITDNEWSANSDLLWDVIAKHQYIMIRQRKSRILFEIDLRKEVPFIMGLFWWCGKRIWITRRCIRIGPRKISGNVVEGRGISVVSLPGGRFGIGIG